MSNSQENFRSNEDFRKLLASRPPVVVESKNKEVKPKVVSSEAAKKNSVPNKKPTKNFKNKTKKEEFEGYGEQNKILNEIMVKYKDRAAERRKEEMEEILNRNNQQKNLFEPPPGKTHFDPTNDFMDSAMKRKQEIEESKYLGGDMEHTHLVKGLDYSLLNKVRSEMQAEEEMKEEEIERQFLSKKDDKNVFEIKTIFAKKIEAAILRSKCPEVNPNFRKGRMAFSYDLEDDNVDIPLTILRSIPQTSEIKPMRNKLDKLVYHKLSTVLSYLRIDPKKRKKLIEEKNEKKEDVEKLKNMDIFDNEDEYIPTFNKSSESSNALQKKGSYFENEKKIEAKKVAVDNVDIFGDDEEKPSKVFTTNPSIQKRLLEIEGKGEEDAYSEYYPSACGFGDSIISDDDSDDDSKNKKRKPVQEKGEKYEGNRKSRYETKIQEGKLNSQLNKINQIIEKRKANEEKGIPYKKPKF
uniref:RED_N domain-containing protein n=1 Tax=Parastrongyloides trichosuri TaxID=131310 RepID=A0A0N4ZG67_PARTI